MLLAAFQHAEGEGVVVPLSGRVAFGRYLDPGGFVERREDGLAFRVGLDFGDVETAGAGQGGGEDSRAADDADFIYAVLLRRLPGDLDGLVQGGADQRALG